MEMARGKHPTTEPRGCKEPTGELSEHARTLIRNADEVSPALGGCWQVTTVNRKRYLFDLDAKTVSIIGRRSDAQTLLRVLAPFSACGYVGWETGPSGKWD